MKSILSLFTFCMLFFACTNEAPKEDKKKEVEKPNTEEVAPTENGKKLSWDEYWKAFNDAVQKDDAMGVASMTVLPLKEVHKDDVDESNIESVFKDIFDDKVKEVFGKADGRSFNDMTVTDAGHAAAMKVEPGTDIRTISVLYVYDEGTDSQTESSRIFNFGKVDGAYKLLSIITAG